MNRTKRIAQLTQVEIASDGEKFTSPAVANATGYLPQFKGMYVLTEIHNTQTKLFDYTELINKEDRVDTLDIDNDGDKDYIFVLGGILYVKNTYLKNPEKIIDNKIIVQDIGTEIPEVPNNFDQVLSTPSELNISFRNTVETEKEWRMEFYDKYLEWDKATINPDTYSSSPRTTADLLLKPEFPEFQNGIRSLPVQRYLDSGQNGKDFTIE